MALSTAPVLEPRFILGLKTGVRKGVQYISDSEVLYPAGSILVLHNFVHSRQRYIYHCQETTRQITCLAMTVSKTVIAVGDKGEGKEKPTITLYDSDSLKCLKVLSPPPGSEAQEFQNLQFTHDNRYLVAILGDPDWAVLYYSCERGKVESSYKEANSENPRTVLEVLPNPTDATIMCMVGSGLFRLVGLSESIWRPYGFSKSDKFPLTCSCWLGIDRVLAGTEDGQLLLVEYGELKVIFDAMELEEIDLKSKEIEEMPPPTIRSDESLSPISSKDKMHCHIRELISFAKGFAFVLGIGTVILFEKLSNHKYVKRNVFKLEAMSEDDGPTSEEPVILNPSYNSIQTLQMNPSENALIATTCRSQLYTVSLWGPKLAESPEIFFTPLGESLHEGPITAVTVCSWKNIFLTCGLIDHTIRIWNYTTGCLELSKWFQEDIRSASLHPTGLYAIVGFMDKLRFMEILIDELKTLKKFPIRGCKACAFSTNGHLFAAVDFSLIHLYSSTSYELMISLRGHNGRVTSISWNSRDTKLVSCGLEGAVYEWDTSTGVRIGEIIEKTCHFSSVTLTTDGNITYAVGSDGLLREISQSQVIRELSIRENEALNFVLLSHSDLMLFVTGGKGSLFSVEFPLYHGTKLKEYHIHDKPVTAMCLTYDDLTLITCSEDGSIILWKLLEVEGKTMKIDPSFAYFNDILVNKEELEDKNNAIKDLKLRMQELAMEHSYQQQQIETAHAEKFTEIHAVYSQTIKELKEFIEQMEEEHTEEINNINADIAKMKDDFDATIASLEATFNSKLIIEYDKYSASQNRGDEMRNNFLQQLDNLTESKRQAIQTLTENYEQQVHEKQLHIEELLQEAAVRVKEHEEIRKQIEEDADREIQLTKTNFEDKLKEEIDTVVRLRGEIGVTKKKFISSQKEIEENKHQIATLNAELRRFIDITINQDMNIIDLKKEIHERDATIQEKEGRIHELKRKNQELEKYKFVLTYKIKDLKNEIEPKEREIRELKQKISAMEAHLAGLQKINTSLELQDKELSEELLAIHKALKKEVSERRKSCRILNHLRLDIHNTSGLIQEPRKLKEAVKMLYHKYNTDAAYTSLRKADKEVNKEFARQRQFLEKTIHDLERQVILYSSGKMGEAEKITEENIDLIDEVNKLRNELSETQLKVRCMQSVLGLSPRYMDPKLANEKLQKAVKSRAEIRKEFDEKVHRLETINLQLHDEINNLNAVLDNEKN